VPKSFQLIGGNQMATDLIAIVSENGGTAFSPRYLLSPEACFSTDHDGTAVLNLESGKFHSLIGAGSVAWSKIVAHPEGITLDMVVDELLTKEDEFAGEPREKVELAVTGMLDMLTEIGLVEASNSPSPRISGSVRSWTSNTLASVGRQVTDLLIRLRRPRVAAFLEFAIFQIIRRIGHFPARLSIVKGWPITPRQGVPLEEIPQLCVAVDEAATWYPKESLCLQKASVKTCLLRQYGIPAEMKIGVHKQPFQAHAWVEVSGDVVGDYKGVQKYFKVIACW
jgi:hypothetical protein